jgi:hypothetical protein
MPTTFSQQHHDPEFEPKLQSRFPISAAIWIPLAAMFACGIVYSARFGYERATAELGALPDPAAANETLSRPFLMDPGDDPVVLAVGKQALRDPLAAPPGSAESDTVIISEPLTLRISERDSDIVRVIVIGGEHGGRRFWMRAERLREGVRPAR